MKGLIYPFTGLALIAIVAFTVWMVTTSIQGAREIRAISRARWEPYTDIKGAGLAEVGIRLMARWGDHEKTIRHDPKVEEVNVENLMERIEAEGRALMRAEAYNNVLRGAARENE